MKDNQIYLNINKEGKLKVSFKRNIDLAEFIQILSTAAYGQMKAVVRHLPESEQQAAKEELYDLYNAAASGVLQQFAPDIEMRPHLTTQAILEAENNIIEREYRKKCRASKKNTQNKVEE